MVAHGKDSWTLADYSWDPKTCIGVLTYERTRVDTGETQTKVVARKQDGVNWKF